MGVLKFYQYEEVKSAIDMANQHYYRQLLRVRSDVSNREFSQKKVKNSTTSGPLGWTGRGADVGHSFRHVEGTHEAGKSTYEDEYEAVMCTRELLNSAAGQKILGKLDAANATGEDNPGANFRIKTSIKGVYYGFPSTGGAKQRIASAVCEVMKLGVDTLWIHTTYPDKFQVS
jgi:hypothetical protein